MFFLLNVAINNVISHQLKANKRKTDHNMIDKPKSFETET